jgi:hypothetical protein
MAVHGGNKGFSQVVWKEQKVSKERTLHHLFIHQS